MNIDVDRHLHRRIIAPGDVAGDHALGLAVLENAFVFQGHRVPPLGDDVALEGNTLFIRVPIAHADDQQPAGLQMLLQCVEGGQLPFLLQHMGELAVGHQGQTKAATGNVQLAHILALQGHPLANLCGLSGKFFPGDLEHVFRKIDPAHRVPGFRQGEGHPPGAAAHLQQRRTTACGVFQV